MPKSRIISTITSTFFKLVILILLIALINLLNYFFGNIDILQTITYFLNSNLALIIAITLFFFISELIYILRFPLSLFSPPFEVIGCIFLVKFIFEIIRLIENFITVNIMSIIAPFETIIYLLVIALVLIFRYFQIFMKFIHSISIREKREKEKQDIKEKQSEEKTKEKDEEESRARYRHKKKKKR